jgi:hypothetical protein
MNDSDDDLRRLVAKCHPWTDDEAVKPLSHRGNDRITLLTVLVMLFMFVAAMMNAGVLPRP